MTTVKDCKIIELPKISARQGNLTAVEASTHIPFDIARVYYLYDIPGGEARGGHAHKELHQVLIALMGSFDVLLNDGQMKETVTLNRAYFGLYVTNYIWREIVNISSGAICLVLASHHYDRDDYIYDFAELVKIKKSLRQQ